MDPGQDLPPEDCPQKSFPVRNSCRSDLSYHIFGLLFQFQEGVADPCPFWGDLFPLTSDSDPPSHEHTPQSHPQPDPAWAPRLWPNAEGV